MTKWETEFKAERTVLGQSWRIPKSVHGLAQRIIKRVGSRVDKPYESRPEIGTLEQLNSPWNIHVKHGEDVLILYRSHCLREDIEDVLINRGIPYITDNGGGMLRQRQIVQYQTVAK